MLVDLDGLITKIDIADVAKNEKLILDDEVRVSILEAMKSIDVQACPGSGKTTLIAAKLILLAQKWPFSHKGICVLSHTNVAKDEIISRLKSSKTKEALSLLQYPHFIGTIQEFVNRFLALPNIRRSGAIVRFIDDEDGMREVLKSGQNLNDLYSSLYRAFGGTESPWPRNDAIYEKVMRSLGTIFWLNTKMDLALYGNFGALKIYRNDETKKLYPKLKALKKSLEKNGAYRYRDMFIYANHTLDMNEKIATTMRTRFPFVMLDEMQDTQRFQDELLTKVFPLKGDTCIQRFGDPDQAIFQGMGGDEPNCTFNNKSREEMDFVLHNSHRFDDLLATKIKSFSLNEIPLQTELSIKSIMDRAESNSKSKNFEHTVIVFNDTDRHSVIERFAQLVSFQFSQKHKLSDKFTVKVVGAVGNEIDPNEDQLKIGHYWPYYQKNQSKNTYKPKVLINGVRHCRASTAIDWSDNYKIITNCILALLSEADKKDEDGKKFSAITLEKYLKNNGRWETYRKAIYRLLNDKKEIDEPRWIKFRQWLVKLLDIEEIEEHVYLSFTEDIVSIEPELTDVVEGDTLLLPLRNNKVRHSDGFNIEFSTIHGVKGETHDATLVIETKHHCFDLGVMIEHLTAELPTAVNTNLLLSESANSKKANKKFLRQLYVAMSRPKHLLCIAMHSSRISENQIMLLRDLNWEVIPA